MFWTSFYFIWWSLNGKSYVFLWFYRGFWCISILRDRDGIKKLIVCHIISENGIQLTLNVAKPFVKKITKSNEACRHNDAIKWKHFLRHWPFVRGIHWSPVNSPHKCQWHEALMFPFMCAWIDGWVNNREAGDVIRHRAHYDATVTVPVPASHPGYYPGTLSCSLVTMQLIVCGPGCGRSISKWVAETNNRTNAELLSNGTNGTILHYLSTWT